MLDRGISGFVPAIFEEKPELLSVYSGFTWYPNCASFAGHTLVGAPPLYGGYEYTPRAVNSRENVSLLDKHKEAYLLLPRLFSDAGYAVTVTDPPFDNYKMANTQVFEDARIYAVNLNRRYSNYWRRQNPHITGLQITGLLKNNLIRFSFFKIAPLVLRSFIYDDGDWLATVDNFEIKGALAVDTIDDYSFLEALPKITAINSDSANTLAMVYVHLAHSAAFLQTPDYIPVETVTNKGSSEFAQKENYHVNIASFLLLGKWFSFLKANGAYHNTRIIIAADHGANGNPPHMALPNGKMVSTYNPVFMVKDFDAQGALSIDNSFMTNADAPLFALQGIIDQPLNPFTRAPLKSGKEQGVDIVTIDAVSSHQHTKYQYRVRKNQWLHVKDNIFDAANWSAPN